MNALTPYNKFLAPEFKFNQSFVDYILYDNQDLTPWWFFAQSANYIEYWCTTVQKLYPMRNLVPFANWIYTDDIVCFDGSDKSCDPKVFYIHAFASPGWEGRGCVDNFSDWLLIAKKDSHDYKAELNAN